MNSDSRFTAFALLLMVEILPAETLLISEFRSPPLDFEDFGTKVAYLEAVAVLYWTSSASAIY